jgi:hypothetical protein
MQEANTSNGLVAHLSSHSSISTSALNCNSQRYSAMSLPPRGAKRKRIACEKLFPSYKKQRTLAEGIGLAKITSKVDWNDVPTKINEQPTSWISPRILFARKRKQRLEIARSRVRKGKRSYIEEEGMEIDVRRG